MSSSLVSSAAVIYTNTADYVWNLNDSSGAPNTGNGSIANTDQYSLSDPQADGQASALFQGIVDATSGGSSLSVTHQNDGTLPNFPPLEHSVSTTLIQDIRFIAEPGDGSFSFAGTIIANPTAGTPGTAQARFRLINLTLGIEEIDVSVVNGQIPGSSVTGIALNAGQNYQVIYETQNDKVATSTTFGGAINSGGTLTYNLTGGTWSYDATAIPEPSSLILLALSNLFILRRKR